MVLNWPRTLLGPVKSPILEFLTVVINNEQFSSPALPPSTDSLIPYPPPPGLGRTNEVEALQSYERGQRRKSGSRVSLSAAGLLRGKPLSESRPTRGGPAARPSICYRPHHLPVGVPRVRTGPRRACARRATMTGIRCRALLFLLLLQSAPGKDTGRTGGCGAPQPGRAHPRTQSSEQGGA